MRFTLPLSRAVLTLAACVALPSLAQQNSGRTSASASSYTGQAMTRAEVLADLQIWRASGLAAYEAEPAVISEASADYRAARARYANAGSSPEFYALVQAIAARRGEVLPQRLAASDRAPE